jgi:hypothetical protein
MRVMLIAQSAPGVKEPPTGQVLPIRLNSLLLVPMIPTLEIARGAVPSFESVTDSGGLVVPSIWLGNIREDGEGTAVAKAKGLKVWSA